MMDYSFLPSQMSVIKALWLKFRTQLLMLLFIWLIGTGGYMLIEGWEFLEALYMTVITITTVGFGEIRTMSEAGRVFTIFIVVGGVSVGAYAVGNIASFMIGGEARRIYMENQLENRPSKLKDHVILLGFGKFGHEVAEEVSRRKQKLVIIENREERVEQARNEGYEAIKGDGVDEHLLEKVGVKRARGLVAALSEEADNGFAVLTARVLNPQLTIVTRGEEEESEKKLLRAGANRVILPYRIGGRRMAAVVLQPAILDFLDVIFSGDDLALELMEINLDDKSKLIETKLGDSNIRGETGGALIVGVKKKNGELIPNPDRTTKLTKGDRLVAMVSSPKPSRAV